MSRNRVIGGFEDAFESGSSSVATAVKQTAKDFTASAKGQITGGSTASSPVSQSQPKQGGGYGTNEHSAQQNSQSANQLASPKSDEEREKFLRDLYGGGGHSEKSNSSHSDSGKTGLVKGALGIDSNKGLSPEDEARKSAAWARFHNEEYYQPLINRQKPKEEPVTEKLERENQMEAIAEQKKQDKKPGPLSQVKQGTGESVVGVSG